MENIINGAPYGDIISYHGYKKEKYGIREFLQTGGHTGTFKDQG